MMSKDDKIRAIRFLDDNGAFLITKSGPKVCQYFGISTYTLYSYLDEIRKTYDLSILMTTHDFAILPRYADQAVLLGGTVLAQGKPEDVLSCEAFARVFHGKGGSV
jgi:hypothetical protein